jgi:hypothetical protein
MTLKYASDTVLPGFIFDLFEKTKEELCALSYEPDKTTVIIDELRSNIISWFAYHVTDRQ